MIIMNYEFLIGVPRPLKFVAIKNLYCTFFFLRLAMRFEYYIRYSF